MSDVAERIKAAIPLEDVIGESVVLKSAGRGRLKGLCPFHVEKTPSFHVMTDRGFFYCFGCQAKGDLFDFVQRLQNLDFLEARALLAQRAGVTLPDRFERNTTKSLYDLQVLAQNFFVAGLRENEDAYSYLLGRGLTAETISSWGLGFAPQSWNGLIAYAKAQNVEPEMLERAGLAGNKGGRFYDWFRGRITIPIHDSYGRIVGFSARVLGNALPKYVNSPETDLFKKGNVLFGLDKAKAAIRSSRAAILVEGQLDVITAHQAGFNTVVGAQSSTLTEAQIAAFNRLDATRLVLSYDADAAGQRASLAACEVVARQFLVRVARLPGTDPAETIRQNPEAFRRVLDQAIPETEFRLEQALAGLDLKNPDDKKTALERLRPGLRDMRVPFDPVADDLRRLVSEHLELDLEALRTWVKPGGKVAPLLQPQRPQTDKCHGARLQLAALVLHDAELTSQLLDKLEAIVPSSDDVLANFCVACKADPSNFDKALSAFTDADRTTIYNILAQGFDNNNVVRAFDFGLRLYTSLTKSSGSTSPQLGMERAAALTDRQRAVEELAAALPEEKQLATLTRFGSYLIDRRRIDAATGDELRADATALRACARSWALGRPANPAQFLPPPTPSVSSGAA